MPLTPNQKSLIRRAVVEAAQARLGVHEIGPPYNNRGYEVDQYLAYVGIAPGNPWCAAFASYCLHLGGAIPGAGLVEPSGYVPALIEHARRLGTLMSAADVASGAAAVKPGDLVCVWECYTDVPARNNYHHTGIVELPPTSAGEFHSIEGNSNTDGSAEGWKVVRQVRRLDQVAPDGHSRYAFICSV